MTLAGTRPPTVDEWELYEPHHRARMSFRPGLTGMWQVSGRSNITDLNLYAIVKGEDQADLSAWREAQKKSLCSGFNDADPDAIIAWNKRMADLVAMDEIAKAIRNKVPAAKLRKRESLTKIQNEVFMDSLVGVADCKLVWE